MADIASAQDRLNRGVGEAEEGFITASDIQASYADLEAAWQEDIAAVATGSTFDVKIQGALGDGSADDTASIQAAIDAASAAGGGVVFFPPGNYRITEPLDIPSYVHIEGSEPASRYWAYSTSTPPSACSIEVDGSFSGSAALSIGAGTTAISVRNITIAGRNVGSVHGILVGTPGTENNYLFEHVAIIGMGGDGFRGQLYAARFETVFIGGCHGWGMNASGRFTDTYVSNSYFAGNIEGGLALAGTTNSGLCVFNACRFERSGFNSAAPTTPTNADAPGIYLRRANDIKFIACETDANSGHGVDISCASGAHLYNLHFVACDFRRDGFGDMTTQDDFAGIYIHNGAGSNPSEIWFTDCTVSASYAGDGSAYPSYMHPKYGLWMEDTAHIRILGGRIDGEDTDLYFGGDISSNYRPQLYLPKNGLTTVAAIGSTASRPTDPPQGALYYDTTLQALAWYNGSDWGVAANDSAAMDTGWRAISTWDATPTVTGETINPSYFAANGGSTGGYIMVRRIGGMCYIVIKSLDWLSNDGTMRKLWSTFTFGNGFYGDKFMTTINNGNSTNPTDGHGGLPAYGEIRLGFNSAGTITRAFWSWPALEDFPDSGDWPGTAASTPDF